MREFVQMLSPDKLTPFAGYPFQVREDESLDELMESIRCYGVLSPLLARPKGEGYELVSGHRRRLAAQKLSLEAVPVLVREMSDDEAVILMVDSNLQREHLLPSEKAFAYKMKLEALKHQGKAALSQVATKSGRVDTASVIGEQAGESRDQVFRYIRLTNLVPPLLKLVDEGRIAFSPAVELSYLTKEEQAELWDLIEQEDATPSLSQAIRMKQLSRMAKLTPEAIYAIISEEKPNQKEQVRLKTESLKKVFSQPLQHAADGKSHPEAAGRALPQQTPWAGAIISYTWNLKFFKTVFGTNCAVSSIIPVCCLRSRITLKKSFWRPSFDRWQRRRVLTRT